MKNVLLLLTLAACAAGCATPPEPPQHTTLFRPGEYGSKYYRIPALVTTTQGTLLAVADRRIESQGDLPNAIDLVLRRSTDNGATWSEPITIARHTEETGYGDAAVVVDRTTGEVICIFASGCGLWNSTAEHPIDIEVARSSDDGVTWSAPKRITPQIYGPECPAPAVDSLAGLFAASGRALQLADGGLLFVVAAHRTGDQWPPLRNYVCRSDDGGHTWHLLPAEASHSGDESKIIERADGSWLMSIRNPEKGYRRYALSHDKGASWSKVREWKDLPDPACNGDLLRYSLRSEGARRDRMLHSIPADTAERRNVSVALSYDEGKSWPVRKTVWAEPAGYSSLTRLADGSIGLLTEVGDWDTGFEIRFTRLTMEWLTDGADDGR